MVLVGPRGALLGAFSMLWAGCLSGDVNPGSRIEVAVAPLSLPGLKVACYGLAVSNGVGDPVWAKAGICSDTYGNGPGGDITYIGTCDASQPNHTVTLVMESLTDDKGSKLVDGKDWQNPCRAPTGCTQPAVCRENADTLVTFDVTVMRSAKQGFFDVAVDFEDVFCSGKIDCKDSSGEPLDLVFNRDGERDQSVVVALACTGGPGEGDATTIHMNDIRIACGEGREKRISGFSEPLFGGCFETEAGATITGHALQFVAVDANANNTPVYQELLSQNVRYDSGTSTWDPDSVTVDANGFDGGAIFTRLGVETALVAYVNHGVGHVPMNQEIGSITQLALGVARFNATDNVWENVAMLVTPTPGPFLFPEYFDGTYLVASDRSSTTPRLLVYKWTGTVFEAGVEVLRPDGYASINAGNLAGFRDGYLLWAGWKAGIYERYIAKAPLWTLTRLGITIPYTIPAGFYEGETIAPTLGFGDGTLLHGGRVAVVAWGSNNELLTGLFVPSGTGWAFELHPIYSEYPATIDATLPTNFNVGGPLDYHSHYLFTMAGGNPQQMVRIYERSTDSDVVWQRYDTTLGRTTSLNQQSVIGLIERPSLPAVAVFDFVTTSGPSRHHLELGLLVGGLLTNENGVDERVVTPLVSLANASVNEQGGWNLDHVERGRDGRLLVTATGQSSGATYTWRVQVNDGASTATAEVVSITSADLSDLNPTDSSQFQMQGDLNVGDMTSALVPGGCQDSAGYLGQAGPLITHNNASHLAAVDFTAAAPNGIYTAATLGYGAINEAHMAEVLTAPGPSASQTYATQLAPSDVGGNQLVAADVPISEPVFQHAIFAGHESLMCGNAPCNKIYYNTAIGFDATIPNCWLTWEATASGGSGVDPATGKIAAGSVYPIITGSVQLTGADPAKDGLVCKQNPIASDGMGITYTTPTMSGLEFCYSFDGTTLTSHLEEGAQCTDEMRLTLSKSLDSGIGQNDPRGGTDTNPGD